MTTTIEINEPLLRKAKQRAARDGTTLRALVEQGLASILVEPKKPRPSRLVIKPFRGNGLKPEIKSLHWNEIGPLVYDEEDRFRDRG